MFIDFHWFWTTAQRCSSFFLQNTLKSISFLISGTRNHCFSNGKCIFAICFSLNIWIVQQFSSILLSNGRQYCIFESDSQSWPQTAIKKSFGLNVDLSHNRLTIKHRWIFFWIVRQPIIYRVSRFQLSKPRSRQYVFGPKIWQPTQKLCKNPVGSLVNVSDMH